MTHDPAQPQNAVTSATGELEARKMVARYCLLAWTMCYNTFKGPLALEFGTAGQLLEKGLLQDRELTALQVLHSSKLDGVGPVDNRPSTE